MAARKVQHLVLLRFKASLSQAEIDEAFTVLAALPRKIPGIEHFSHGPYSSPEGLNKGFTHGLLFTFNGAEARNNYLPHPEHQAVVQQVLPLLDDVIAFDYEM